MTEHELMRRTNAVMSLVRRGKVDGVLALSYVVWPSEAMQEAEAGVEPVAYSHASGTG